MRKAIIFIFVFALFSSTSFAQYVRDYKNETCIANFNDVNNNILTSVDTSCDANKTTGWGENELGSATFTIAGGNLSTYGQCCTTSGSYAELNTTFRGNLNGSEYRFNEMGVQSEFGGVGFNNGLLQLRQMDATSNTLCYELRWQDVSGELEEFKDTSGGLIANVFDSYVPLNISVIVFPNGSVTGTIVVSLLNGTNRTRDMDNACSNITTIRVYHRINNNGNAVRVTLNNITFVNGSVTGPDIMPPNITYFNLTTDSGCENWVTNKSNPCSTTSVVPTVQFNTSEPAWCSIAGGIDNSSLHRNYTAMGVSRNCTGAAAGEGTTSHLCTLTNTDELYYENSHLFISCKDASNNTYSNSTSGPLKLSITSLETIGKNAIGIGIHDALISGYINYTDLQIYVRNLSNTQAKGTFDRAAKKGSKMWAFNRIGSTESYSTVFNLTPVLYVLELANTTNSSMTNFVGRMINATK